MAWHRLKRVIQNVSLHERCGRSVCLKAEAALIWTAAETIKLKTKWSTVYVFFFKNPYWVTLIKSSLKLERVVRLWWFFSNNNGTDCVCRKLSTGPEIMHHAVILNFKLYTFFLCSLYSNSLDRPVFFSNMSIRTEISAAHRSLSHL